MKAGTIVGNIIGFDFGGKGDKALAPVALAYSPGESQLTAEQQKQLDDLIKRLRGDANLQVRLVHTLGSDDNAILQQRANPTPEEAGQLGFQLRQRKLALQNRRLELAAQLRVALASQDNKLAAETQTALRATSNQIAGTERALDQMLDLLRPNADPPRRPPHPPGRHRPRQHRLDTVREALLASDVPNIANRVQRVPARGEAAEGQPQGDVAIVVTRAGKK
jgi:hypothetical protein